MTRAEADQIIEKLAQTISTHGAKGKEYEKAKAEAISKMLVKTKPLADSDMKEIKSAIKNSTLIVKDARHLLVFNKESIDRRTMQQLAEALKAEGLNGAFVIVKGDANKAVDVKIL